LAQDDLLNLAEEIDNVSKSLQNAKHVAGSIIFGLDFA